MVNFDYLYNPAAAQDAFTKNYFLDKKLGFQVIENGMILPHKHAIDDKTVHKTWGGYGGIIDSAGEYINGSNVFYGLGEKYTPPPESIKHSSETVIYLGLFHHVWGHVLTDVIRRLWFLKSDFMNQFKNCSLVYLNWEGRPLESQKNCRRLLEILEIDFDKIQAITQPTQFDKIILPADSFLTPYGSVKGFTMEYRETINRVRDFALKNRTPTSNKKIYFFNGRRSVGEERLAEYFKSKNYDIVRPENLPLDEQLNLLINAEHFASVGCSAAHNSLFLRDDSEMIFIPRAVSNFRYYQEILNQVHPLNINYVDSSISIFSKGIGFRLHCYIASKQLKNFFGDKWDGYEEEDFKIFLQYVKKSLAEGLTVNPKAMSYYEPIFADFMEQLKQREDLIAAANMPPKWETFQPTLNGYQTHVHNKGWGDWKNENQISNDINQKLDIQAIKINFPNHKVYYSVYFNDDEGWSAEVSNGEMAGTTGKTKAIYGISIRLDEAGSKEFDILYRVHKFDGNWTDWAKNGEAIYSHGQKLNAIQIKLETKAGA